jgi:hypothetical protein
MREAYSDLHVKTRDTAQNIRIAFDESAWNKMEALLNKHDMISFVPGIPYILKITKFSKINHRPVQFLILLFVAVLLFIKPNNSEYNKTSPAGDKSKLLKIRKNNHGHEIQNEIAPNLLPRER